MRLEFWVGLGLRESQNHIPCRDFESFGLPNPLYFNMVRDPFERFRSRFQWTRADFQARFWYANLHYLEPDASPGGRVPFQ